MAQRRWARLAFAAPHKRSEHAAWVLKRKNAYSKAQKSVRLSRHRISFVALCVELDTDQERSHGCAAWIRVLRYTLGLLHF